jgi:predicted aspartyl protease
MPLKELDMGEQNVGRVVTEATIENLQDLWDVNRGLLKSEDARRVAVPNALVDTGASMLSLPTRLIEHLGLHKMYSRRVISSTGEATAKVYEAVRLTIQGRYANMDVMEVPDSVPVLIGQIPLEQLDFVVNPKNQTLIGNPDHGGEHVLEAF